MSQLIRMRQRLKAIGTIKKITSAMRLISRSFHARLNRQKSALHEYRTTTETLLTKLKPFGPTWSSALLFPSGQTTTKKLYIIIGSQKGLCGNYNAELAHWLVKHSAELIREKATVLTVGKRTDEMLKKYNVSSKIVFPELKTELLAPLTQDLLKQITQAVPFYTDVIFVSNAAQTFFVHHLQERTIIPLTKNNQAQEVNTDYHWEHDPVVVLESLARIYLQTTLYTALYECLLGEYAARFIAMDNATRNANSALDAMKLQYNKLRQAKITKELTELTGGFQD